MKRYLTLLLSLLLIFTLCACGGDAKPETEEPSPEPSPEPAATKLEILREGEEAMGGYVLVGVKDDPAGVKEAADIKEAFARIADEKCIFVSLGDGSELHKLEVSLWPEDYAMSTDYDAIFEHTDWYYYMEAGAESALLTAEELEGYILCDKESFTKLQNGEINAENGEA